MDYDAAYGKKQFPGSAGSRSERPMKDYLDLERYPLDQPGSTALSCLETVCRQDLAVHGMFNLEGFVRPAAVARMATELLPLSERHSYTHRRRHNVYFDDQVRAAPGQVLARFDTAHHTLCDDQIQETLVHALYEWTPLPAFLARVLNKPLLCVMADPLARVNVIEYRSGETLNWHFDRSLFTTTLLIQAAEQGGEFQYRSNLRSDADPNHDGVAAVLRDQDPQVRVNPLAAGTLNVFAGKNTLHRVSTVQGSRSRIIAVYSYYETPNVMFSPVERRGFYGRDE